MYREFLLSAVVSAVYTTFLLTLLATAVILRGACLYTFWLPREFQMLSPFWVTVVAAISLSLWAFAGLRRAIRQRRKAAWPVLYHMFAVICLVWWLYDLHGFWRAMEYERGVIPAAQYFTNGIPGIGTKPYLCHGW